MCMQVGGTRPHHRYNWSGDEIVADSSIPASRRIPGTRASGYPIDVREYLLVDGNAVIRKKRDEIFASLSPEDLAKLRTDKPGSFDLRADLVRHWAGQHLDYRPTRRLATAAGGSFESWLFPDETLHLGKGDCEDLSFVIVTLLEALGVSPYCLRVAFGNLVVHTNDATHAHAHAWAMYLNEQGAWEIIEPLAHTRRRAPAARKQKSSPPDVSYVPHFVFNRHHLWRVRTAGRAAALPLGDYLTGCTFWDDFDPRFAIAVHEDLYDRAFTGMSLDERQVVRRASWWIDVNLPAYDPRDHFDFACIPEGWQRVAERLKDSRLEEFGRAAHAVADFYVHSAYGLLAALALDQPLAPITRAILADTSLWSYEPKLFSKMPGSSHTPDQAPFSTGRAGPSADSGGAGTPPSPTISKGNPTSYGGEACRTTIGWPWLGRSHITTITSWRHTYTATSFASALRPRVCT